MVRIPKVPCTKLMMTMLALSCYKRKKERAEKKKIYMIKNGRRKKRRILLFQAFVTTTKAHGPYILIVYVA